MANAHLGTTIDQAQNAQTAQTLQGKIPSDFLAVGGKAVDSDKLDGLDSTQFLRNDQTQSSVQNTNGTLQVISSNDNTLNLKKIGIAGTAGVKNAGWNYIQFLDSEGDRQGYFGINSTGDFAFQPEITGNVFIGTSKVLHAGIISAFLASASADGFMAKADKSKLDGIQTSAINQTTADGRYVNYNNGTQTIIGGQLIIDNVNYDTHLKLKRTVSSVDYGLSIAPNNNGLVDFNVLSGTTGFNFVGTLKATGNISSDTATYNGVVITTLNTNVTNHIGSGGSAHALATTTVHGFMDFNDKVKLNGIQTSAINQTTADGRYLQLTGGTLTGELTIQDDGEGITFYGGGRIYKQTGNGLKLKAHADSVGVAIQNVAGTDVLVVKTDGSGMTYQSNVVFHNGNKSSYLASSSVDGFMAKTDKSKLDGIASGAEVNQNAFSTIAVAGNANVVANSKTSTLTFIAGTGMSITTDATGLTVNFTSTLNSSYLSLDGTNAMSNTLNINDTLGSTAINGAGITINRNQIYFQSKSGSNGTVYIRANESSTSEIQIQSNGTILMNGNTAWHSGNFNPSTKLDKTGGTLTGQLIVPTGSNGGIIFGTASTISDYQNTDLMAWSTNGSLYVGNSYNWDNLVAIKFKATTIGGNDQTMYIGQYQKNNANWTQGRTELWTGGVSRLTLTNTLATLSTPIRGSGQGNTLRIDSGTGWVDVGAVNASWAHFYTDRTRFYFDKQIAVHGAISSFGTDDLVLQTGDSGSGGTTRITVKNSNGYVGILNTSPAYALDVAGSIKFVGVLQSTSVIDFMNGASAQTMRVGGITVSNAYTDSSKQPANGIYSKGDVYTDGVLNVSNKVKIQFNTTENSLDFVFI